MSNHFSESLFGTWRNTRFQAKPNLTMLHEQYLGLVEIVKIVVCLIELTIGMHYMPVELTDIELLSIVEVVTKAGIGLPTA